MILVASVHSPQNWLRHISRPRYKQVVSPWCRIVIHRSSSSSSSSFTPAFTDLQPAPHLASYRFKLSCYSKRAKEEEENNCSRTILSSQFKTSIPLDSSLSGTFSEILLKH
jgi:hypothetical protein